MKRKTSGDANTIQISEWSDIVCPICMEHPHNAVILRCSSYKKGCRSYICDTSYMHSNCLDRFAEQNDGLKSGNHSLPSSSHWNISGDFTGANLDMIDGIEPLLSSGSWNLDMIDGIEPLLSSGSWNRSLNDIVTSRGGMSDSNLNQGSGLAGERLLEAQYSEAPLGRVATQIHNTGVPCQPDVSITCPLCRGIVAGWEIAVEGRKHLNLLKRNCSHDGCSFLGNYRELRQHARNDHFGISPVNADPTREQTWHHLEQQRERDDIISALHSETPDAVVLGDYVIERNDRPLEEDEDAVDQPWLDRLYILHMINSAQPESSRRQRPWSRHRRFPTSERIRMPGASSDRSRLLWGENLLGMQDDEDSIEGQATSNIHVHDADVDQSPAHGRR